MQYVRSRGLATQARALCPLCRIREGELLVSGGAQLVCRPCSMDRPVEMLHAPRCHR